PVTGSSSSSRVKPPESSDATTEPSAPARVTLHGCPALNEASALSAPGVVTTGPAVTRGASTVPDQLMPSAVMRRTLSGIETGALTAAAYATSVSVSVRPMVAARGEVSTAPDTPTGPSAPARFGMPGPLMVPVTEPRRSSISAGSGGPRARVTGPSPARGTVMTGVAIGPGAATLTRAPGDS